MSATETETPPASADQRAPVLQARNLVKRFGKVTALSGADLDLCVAIGSAARTSTSASDRNPVPLSCTRT